MEATAKQIIAYLSKQAGFVKSGQLAEALDVSTKTIYRTVKRINQEKDMILSQRGLGYKLDTTVSLDPREDLSEPDDNKKRTFAIGFYLLFNQASKPKFLATADKFYISESALVKELQKINLILAGFNVHLVHKDGRIGVMGNELDMRQALNFFLIRKGAAVEGFTSISEIFPSIADNDRSFIITQLTLIQDELNVVLVDPYTLNIFSHLYILLGRIRSIDRVHPQKAVPTDGTNNRFYATAQLIIENISRYTNKTIDASEVVYLSQYLLSLRYMHSNDIQQVETAAPASSFDQPVLDFAQAIIQNYPFSHPINRQHLLTDLCAHIKPMLNRFQTKLVVVNPLMDEIKASYSSEFAQTKRIVNDYAKSTYQMGLSDDEVSFITLYIVKAIEESTEKRRALLMCTTGIGTAQLLRTKLLKAIPNLEITDVISSYSYRQDMTKYDQNADLIISTVAIPEQSKIPIVVVSPLFNELDLQRVKVFLNV